MEENHNEDCPYLRRLVGAGGKILWPFPYNIIVMYVLYQRVHHYKCYGGCSNVMTILRWC
jgi:hypothetical protein